ncbi:serine/threonine-protein phosphatase 4 regulatory subunit 3B-like [Passer montanus]|uniref:serine/threonine-protein phosphatase 4 regulatory subunit 3B-like n=1 Tax=Passer montanus TaxID=9160 RepID=UPI0019621CF2|nr:serine/threonine-protein phosphatase 4 regulatory subunit 3B-like [Passer montanus]
MGRIRRLIDLPACELHSLGELAELMSSVHVSLICTKKLTLALKNEGYIPKLLQLFQVCESAKDTESLHLLFEIMKGILCLDKTILFKVMFSDEYILGVIGCLEYDPRLAQPGRYREFLTKKEKLQDVIPVRNPELRQKIRQTSRAQYIQAIINPNPLDFKGGSLSTLNSFISSSKHKIFQALQKDQKFLPEVFARLTNEDTAAEQQCELMKFFKEFCAFSCMLPKKRDEFLQTLVKLKFLPILEMLMKKDDLQVRSGATDILCYLVEFSPTTVQQFVMQEAKQNENDTQLITEIIEQIVCSPDPEFGGDNKLMEILCALINPQKMLAVASHLEVFEFLDIFYDRYIQVLIAPLLAHTSEEWNEIDTYQTAEILASVLKLLSFCVERHKYHMKNFVIKNDLLRRTLVLMKSRHKFLALCVLRFMRRIIGLQDNVYNQYITVGNLFEPVVNAVLENKYRCNLLMSASIELFEFIRQENMHFLIAHIVENFSDALESVKYIHTFQELKTKYEQAKKQEVARCEQQEKLNRVSILPGETLVKKAVVSQDEGEEKAAPTSPASSSDSHPTNTTLAAVMAAPKRGIFEIFGYPDDEDDETSPKKKARLDS